jgi:hypothetical protein
MVAMPLLSIRNILLSLHFTYSNPLLFKILSIEMAVLGIPYIHSFTYLHNQ